MYHYVSNTYYFPIRPIAASHTTALQYILLDTYSYLYNIKSVIE